MPDHVAEIKSRLDIVDVITGYIQIQRSGVNFKARCPFHNEKTPSFYISPERQSWHCFGCSKGGDMFSFVQDIEGVEFPEALRMLAQKAGVTLEYTQHKLHSEKTRLLDIHERATKFFEAQLWNGNAGARALAYLRDRGLTDDTIRTFRIGYAPNDWHALSTYLTSCGYTRQEIIASGVAVPKDGRSYDRFRGRIMFPIADVNGRVIAFTARVLPGTDDVGAKYINTPQTALYDKGSVLFGLDKARLAIRHEGSCVLVEGNMDVIMSHQAGAMNTVATSGTALTPQQLKLIHRYTQTIDFCFDADQAGEQALRRGIGLALAQEFTVRALRLSGEHMKDPADYVREHGNEAWLAIAKDAQPIMDFYIARAEATLPLGSADGKKQALSLLGPMIRRMTSRVEQDHWTKRVAQLVRSDEAAVRADLATIRDDLEEYARPEVPTVPAAAPATLRGSALDDALLTFAFVHPAVVAAEEPMLTKATIDPVLRDALLAIARSTPESLRAPEAFTLIDPESRFSLDALYMRAHEVWSGVSERELSFFFRTMLARAHTELVRSQLRDLESAIRDAEARKDVQEVTLLAGRAATLTQQLALFSV
ncbi:MAG: DNA primase [Candidatus Paceibacterota bacterium]|nr:MAG: DNA primase [Candidatus Paceibacterota bacterium]